MKPVLFLLSIVASVAVLAQDPIAVANKCYSEKNYECATEQYKKVLSEKKYRQEDHSLIVYRIGYSLGQLKRNDEALRYLKDAITAKPDYADAYWTTAWVYRTNLDDHEQATQNYTKAINLLSNDTKSLKSLYYSRGDSYYTLGKDSLALNDFLSSLKIDSTNGNAYVGAGNAAYGLKKYKDAGTWYKQSIKYGDTSKAAMSARHYLYGQTFFKQNKFDDALIHYKNSLEVLPSYGTAQWGIAAVYYNQKKWQDAIREYNKTMTLYKDDMASQKQLNYWIGKCYGEAKDYTKAVAHLDAAIKINPNYSDAVWEKASVYYRQKKWKEAIPLYTRTIELNKGRTTDLDDLHYYRGYCHIKLKDTASAKADFKKSLSLDYSALDANTQMGNINYAEKKYDDARINYSYGIRDDLADTAELSRIYFRKGFCNLYSSESYLYTGKDALLQSIKLDSANKEAHRYLADVYYTQTYYKDAETELTKCIQLYKNVKDSLPVMYIYRATSRWQLKKWKEALEDYEQADKLQKFTQTDRVKTMGQFAFEVKDYPKAISIFTRLIPMYKADQKTELMFAYYGRGRSSFELKKKDPAVADLTKALEYEPNNTEIKGWLTKAKAL